MTTQQTTSDYARQLPQATDIEEVVIGAILLNNECYDEVDAILAPDDFYHNGHQLVYSAIQKLIRSGGTADILTVTQCLKSDNKLEDVGGVMFISALTNRIASTAAVEHHARIVQQMSIRRSIIALCSAAAKSAYEESIDVFDTINSAGKLLTLIDAKTSNSPVESLPQLLARQADVWKHREQSGSTVVGCPLGIAAFDAVVHGFTPGQSIIIAGRPGMGKSTVLIQGAINAASLGKPVGIITLEMPAIELAMRILSNVASVNFKLALNQSPMNYEYDSINRVMSRLNAMGIYICDRPGMNETQMKSEIKRLVNDYAVEEVWIDYIQLMRCSESRGKNRDQELGEISRAIKSTAKALSVPIITLSQLNRAVELRPGKRPQLSDLRESGSIEQDADLVVLIYRAEYYDITEDEEGNPTANRMELIIAKHRGGSTADVIAATDMKHYKIMDVPSGSESESTRLPYADHDRWASKHLGTKEESPF